MRKCRNCQYFNQGWCDFTYTRHTADAPRCKEHYYPKNGYLMDKAWFRVIVFIGSVSAIAGGLWLYTALR